LSRSEISKTSVSSQRKPKKERAGKGDRETITGRKNHPGIQTPAIAKRSLEKIARIPKFFSEVKRAKEAEREGKAEAKNQFDAD